MRRLIALAALIVIPALAACDTDPRPTVPTNNVAVDENVILDDCGPGTGRVCP